MSTKPRFNLLEEGAFLTKDGLLQPEAASTLASQSRFLKNFIMYKDSDLSHLKLEEHDLT